MKRVFLIAHLAVLPAMGDDFVARVAEAKELTATPEGTRYDRALAPHIGEAMQSCIPPGSTNPENLGAFAVVADVTSGGAPQNIAVAPRTRVSICVSERLARARLPIPPKHSAKGYPIVVEMRVTP